MDDREHGPQKADQEEPEAKLGDKIVDLDRREILEVLRDVQEISVINALRKKDNGNSDNGNSSNSNH